MWSSPRSASGRRSSDGGHAVVLRATYPRLFRFFDHFQRPVSTLGRIGDHAMFYGRAIAGTPHAAMHYRRGIIRLIAEISLGAGQLGGIGGSVVVAGVLR